MPAVTADTLTLPRLEVPVAGADGGAPRPRPVRSVTTAPSATRAWASRCGGPSPACRAPTSTRS